MFPGPEPIPEMPALLDSRSRTLRPLIASPVLPRLQVFPLREMWTG